MRSQLYARVYSVEDCAAVVEAKGVVDLTTVESFRSAVTEAVATGRSVILDLAGVGYIDSAALQELVSARNDMLASDKRLILVMEPGGQPEYVVRTVMLDTIIGLTHSVDEAIAEARNTAPA